MDRARRDEPGHYDRHRLRQDGVVPAADAGQARQRGRSARRTSFTAPAVRALILYPMNALVNDQLGRLRLLLGRPARHRRSSRRGRGGPRASPATPAGPSTRGSASRKKDQQRLEADRATSTSGCSTRRPTRRRPGTTTRVASDRDPAVPRQVAGQARPAGVVRREGRQLAEHRPASSSAPSLRPDDPELLTRHEVLQAPPDVLITNYSMLEYMLMRPLERPVFDMTRAWLEANPEREVPPRSSTRRTCTAARPARRSRSSCAGCGPASGITADRLQVICTSASFASPEYAREFAAAAVRQGRGGLPDACEGVLADRSPGGARDSAEDAEALAAVPLQAVLRGRDRARPGQRRPGVPGATGASPPTQGTPRAPCCTPPCPAIPPMGLLVNETMQQARPVSELGAAASSRTQTRRWPTGPRRPWSRSAAPPAVRPRTPGCCRAACTPSSGACPGCGHASTRTARRSTAQAHPAAGAVGGCTRSPRRPARAVPASSSSTPAVTAGRPTPARTPTTWTAPAYLWHEPGAPFQSASGPIDRTCRAGPAPGGAAVVRQRRGRRTRPRHGTAEPEGTGRAHPPRLHPTGDRSGQTVTGRRR